MTARLTRSHARSVEIKYEDLKVNGDDDACGELLRCPFDCWDLHDLERNKICRGVCWVVTGVDAGGVVCEIESERCGNDESRWDCSEQDFDPIDDMITI
jgi:hypothetical protein